jgi:hypothetical protein
LVLHTRLDAEALDVAYEDFLWCVSCFKSVDPRARLREAPESLTLDALLRVAAALDIEVDVKLVPAGA